MIEEQRFNKNTNWKVKCERMSTARRDKATDGDNPVIFNTDTNQYEGWNGTEWIALAGGGSGPGNVTASNGLTKDGEDIKLGGVLAERTQINLGSFDFTLQGDNVNFGLGRDCYMGFSDGVGTIGFDLSDRSNGFKINDSLFGVGLIANQDFTANYTDLSYVQKKYVDEKTEKGYKELTLTFIGSGTGNPTFIEHKNDFGVTFTIQRIDTGFYRLNTSSDIFEDNNKYAVFTSDLPTNNLYVNAKVDDFDLVEFSSARYSDNIEDDIFGPFVVEIRVYD